MSVNGLEKITGRILSDAQAEAERIRAEAREDCDGIGKEAQKKANEIRERLSLQAEKDGEAMISRAKSTAAMKKRNLLAQKKSDLSESVFAGAYRRMIGADEETYVSFVTGILCEAIAERIETERKNAELYGEEEETPAAFEILLNAKDRETVGERILKNVSQKLDKKIPAERLAGITLSEKTAAIDGGAVLRYGDVESNCSLTAVFTELRRESEAEVNRTLFGNGNNV